MTSYLLQHFITEYCHNGGHFENKMAAIALKFVAQIYVFKDYSVISSQNLIIKVPN